MSFSLFRLRWLVIGMVIAPNIALGNCETSESQPEMTQCVVTESKVLEGKLESLAKKISAKVSPDRRNAFKTSQSAWLRFRETDCKFAQLQLEGGSAERLARAMCRKERTRQRISDLEIYLEEINR